MKHIELFAGCGGMTLGLEGAGFELFMANELSPMAGETFAYNILGEDLDDKAKKNQVSQKVLWIKSRYSDSELSKRLRENPFEFVRGGYTEIKEKSNLEGKLLIGNIDHLLTLLTSNPRLARNIRTQNIDLLSGGPPCQGFSLAGKRIKDDYKNLLPLSFAKFAGLIQPKVVILENVKGITAPFKTEDGAKHYAWLEVAKAFSLQGFVPVCMLINSKFFGVPQNRPRFILFAFRKDVFEKIEKRKENSISSKQILTNSIAFFEKVQNNNSQLEKIKLGDLNLYNIETNAKLFDGKFLPRISTNDDSFVTAADAIGDIPSTRRKYRLESIKSQYAKKLNKRFKNNLDNKEEYLQNHEERHHSFYVKARFRLYQVLNGLNGIKQDALHVVSGKCTDEKLISKVFNAFKDEALLIGSDGLDTFDKPKNLKDFIDYLKSIESRKHSQRAVRKDEPAPAQMTIPDDLCHYSINELRTFTVREMARFQSFPDWFVFRSKVTTGGKQRSFEVPQYTQIGNAVPPMLAYELGKTIKILLKSIE